MWRRILEDCEPHVGEEVRGPVCGRRSLLALARSNAAKGETLVDIRRDEPQLILGRGCDSSGPKAVECPVKELLPVSLTNPTTD